MTIKRRVAIGTASVVFAVAFACLLVYSLNSRPAINVLFITLDTTRADHLGCYGHKKALTPVLDRLAAEGILFERAYSPAPLTLPTHATLFTGLYPPEHGLRTNGRGKLVPTTQTLATIVADAGYDAGAFVGSFVLDSKFGLDRGFALYDDDLTGTEPTDEALHRQRDGKSVADSAIAWLRVPRSAPFFCWVHFYDPHFPYLGHEEQFGDRFHDCPYDAELAYVDLQVERLLDYIDAARLTDQTLVVVAGDHGEGLGEHVERTHGYTLYDSTQRVPCILRMTGRIAKGQRHATPVSLADILPTVLECLGLRAPGVISGRSLAPALQGGALESTACYAATDDPYLQNAWSPLQSLTTDRWKFIRTTIPELYDLQADPGETRNLAQVEIEQLARMEDALEKMERKMSTREAGAVNLSVNERHALASLGYLGGADSTRGAHVAAPQKLPDVKDMLKFDVAVQEALDIMHAGDVGQATQRLRAIVASSPSHVASRVCLGDALARGGKIAQSVASYEDALKIKPDCVNALLHLGSARISQGLPNDAIAHFEEALRIDPESAVARYNLGLALQGLGQLEEAVTQFEEAMRIDAAAPEVHLALGTALIRVGRSRDAVFHLEQEIKINPRGVEARINLASLLSEKRPDEAYRHLLDALKIDPQNPHVQYNLGAFLLMQGRPKEAIGHLSEAIRIMPNHPRASVELQRARRLAGMEE